MRLAALVSLISLSCLSALADETPRIKVQLFGEHIAFRRSPVLFLIEGGQTYTTEDQPKSQTSGGLRFSIGLDDEARWNFELAMRAKKKSLLTYSGPVSPTLIADFSQDGIEYSWWGPGASYALKLGPVVALNLGFDLRIERVTYFLPVGVIVPEGYSETSMYNRPWARAALTFTIPVSGRVKPQLGVEGAASLVRKNLKTYSTTQYVDPEDMRRGFAPNTSLSFFGGVTF